MMGNILAQIIWSTRRPVKVLLESNKNSTRRLVELFFYINSKNSLVVYCKDLPTPSILDSSKYT